MENPMRPELAKVLRTGPITHDWLTWKNQLEGAAQVLADWALSIHSATSRAQRDKAIAECVSACVRLQNVQMREPVEGVR
jgi:hypothetical protein